MYKNIYKILLGSSLIAFNSMAYSANTIQISGSIVEDTCSLNQSNKDCELANISNKKNEEIVSLIQNLKNKSQKNYTTEISIEQLPDQKSTVITANYY
ncbi:type 1 fimbrial protein [Acinetobacter sp. TR3]|uniref:type 1 fimbrial protein n=1 Tax=Acinetobacter sp. TR3 TaxID=3003392 RepID=UPI0022ABE36F|nr:type 1 fimbrial protein [Acinetobacter sp. TR3]WAU77751.1 type 1 fimbrial protein [Acinetobacter sp. TR3]